VKAATLRVRLFLMIACIGCSENGGTPPSTGGNHCLPGQQVACVCPGGSMGVQICNEEGNGLKVCDCGTLVSDASGDRMMIGGGGGAGPEMDAADDGMSEGSTMLDGASDSDGSTALPDDPCPAAPTVVNCSTTCPNQQTCMPITTTATPCGNTSVVEVDTGATPKPVLRTPSHPGIFTCVANCPKYPAFAIRIRDTQRRNFTASVSAPWELMIYSNIPCGTGFVEPASCLRSAGGALTIYTYDPTAPAQNVTFDDWTAPCPRADAQ
jgi:hypothetical protein